MEQMAHTMSLILTKCLMVFFSHQRKTLIICHGYILHRYLDVATELLSRAKYNAANENLFATVLRIKTF